MTCDLVALCIDANSPERPAEFRLLAEPW